MTNEQLLRPQIRQIFDVYKEIKKPLISYSSTKSLKKSASKVSLKRQNSSPYLLSEIIHKKVSQSKSPKRKNKSIDNFKLKNNTIGYGFRTKNNLSGTF